MATVYTLVDSHGAVISAPFSSPQSLSDWPNYVEMDDSDPRYQAWLVQVNCGRLAAYLGAKQSAVLYQVFSATLTDGSGMTLTSALDKDSQAGLNSLTNWASTPELQVGKPTETYCNADWSSHVVTPAQWLAFAGLVGVRLTSIYTTTSEGAAGVSAGTITTTAQIDALPW